MWHNSLTCQRLLLGPLITYQICQCERLVQILKAEAHIHLESSAILTYAFEPYYDSLRLIYRMGH